MKRYLKRNEIQFGWILKKKGDYYLWAPYFESLPILKSKYTDLVKEFGKLDFRTAENPDWIICWKKGHEEMVPLQAPVFKELGQPHKLYAALEGKTHTGFVPSNKMVREARVAVEAFDKWRHTRHTISKKKH